MVYQEKWWEKITKNTKPIKSTTYYAKWTKKATNTNIDSKLLGAWRTTVPNQFGLYNHGNYWYIFHDDGRFTYTEISYATNFNKTGKYKVSNGKITFTNVVKYHFETGNKMGNCPNVVRDYQIVKQNGKDILKIPDLTDTYYVSISDWYSPYERV